MKPNMLYMELRPFRQTWLTSELLHSAPAASLCMIGGKQYAQLMHPRGGPLTCVPNRTGHRAVGVTKVNGKWCWEIAAEEAAAPPDTVNVQADLLAYAIKALDDIADLTGGTEHWALSKDPQVVVSMVKDYLAGSGAGAEKQAHTDALSLLRELYNCGAVMNWLRVSDDLKQRVELALASPAAEKQARPKSPYLDADYPTTLPADGEAEKQAGPVAVQAPAPAHAADHGTGYARVRIDTTPRDGMAFVTPESADKPGEWNDGAQFFGVLASPAPAVAHDPSHPSTLAGQDKDDAARLDWLEQHDGKFHNYDKISCIIGKGFAYGMLGAGINKTLRGAIDAAMLAAAPSAPSSESGKEDADHALIRLRQENERLHRQNSALLAAKQKAEEGERAAIEQAQSATTATTAVGGRSRTGLPPLPEPAYTCRHEDACGNEVGPPTNYFSAEQMASYACKTRAEEGQS